jgi:predicted ATPase/DNA-binding CsgD family transcriptional regulator
MTDLPGGTATVPSSRIHADGDHAPHDLQSLESHSCKNLPARRTRLIGRERVVAAVQHLLQRSHSRLLTLTGPGGVGKTRLAVEVASRICGSFRDGVWFIPLAIIRDPEQVLPAIAQALGVRESINQPLLSTLQAHLRDKQLLLVLDNVEQVTEAAPLICELLDAPDLRLLVTSRRSLQVYGEQEFPVPPLPLPNPQQPSLEQLTHNESVRLFIERIQAVKPDFVLTESQAPAIAAICARLDGLPLAIELAAARTKLLSPQALLARLDHRLQLLKGGASDLPQRQQTLQNTIAWSYDLLPPVEQRLFTRLAIFVGGWSLAAAEEVCGDDDATLDVLDGLNALLNHSLVYQRDDAIGEPRFGMLETIREFALEQLTLHGETDLLRRRHAAYYLALAETRYRGLDEAQLAAWLGERDREYDNFRAALHWGMEQGDADLALRMIGGLGRFWYLRGYAAEARRWIDVALTLEGPRSNEHHARVLNVAVLLAGQHGYDARSQQLGETALKLYREMGDVNGMTNILNNLGNLALEAHDLVQARTYYEEFLALARQADDQYRIGIAFLNLGWLALLEANYAEARASLETSLTIARSIGQKELIVAVLTNLGWLALDLGDTLGGVRFLADSLVACRDVGWVFSGDETLEGLAFVATTQGRGWQAAQLLGIAHAHRQATGRHILPSFQTRHKRIVAAAQALLEPSAFHQAFTEGQALPLEWVFQTHTVLLEPPLQLPEQAPLPASMLAAPQAPPAIADLTEREIEVLRLVARGMSNAEVAETLVISPLTVNVHLRSIYRKLDVSSRTAAARLAIDHQLI